ncbi:NADPH oxidase 5 isoform X2 [Macrobrachium rosenbergii]|uniref:NADPH oxidase 5 isoform X2 n=1 Tax=Macrobrachium rosenbergii TaxID=79674 RepID=UPI0034D5271B
MVKRDEGPPKLCFDNPVYNDDGNAVVDSKEGSKAKDKRPVTAGVDSRKEPVFPCNRALAATKSLGHEFLKRNASCQSQASVTSDIFAPARTLTPEVDVEERIIEYRRNRDFWSRRSCNNPFRGTRKFSSATVPLATLPVGETLSVASRHDDEVECIPEEYPGNECCMSEATLELLQERRLRENITWLRNYLIEASEADGGNFSLSSFLSAMKNKELLRRWFSLYDSEGEGKLDQEEWIDQIKLSARELGAREWAELLEVLALVVCGEDAEVTEDLFTKILTSRGVLEKLFRLINKDGDGLVSRQEIMDFIANLTYARPRTGFTRENLEWLEQLFRQALGHKQELSFDDFKKIVHSRNSFFAERVFQIFDRDNSGTVSLSEFLDAMHQFAGKSPNDKIKFLFRVYDLDGDGLIQQSELQKVMKACMEENGMKFSDEQIEDLTLALFEDADTQKQGAITYESLKAQLEKHNGLLENLSISIDRWLVPPNLGSNKESAKNRMSRLKPYQMSLPYMKNNYVYLSFLLGYIAVNLGLFISRAVQFQKENGFYIVARACGQCLNFNCMFVLVLILRQCITYLRSMGASAILPLDQHLYLHKMCGWVIFIFSFVHTLMHCINFPLNIAPNLVVNNQTYTAAEWLFTMKPGLFGLIGGIANPTGVALMVILTLMVICSQPFVRKSGYFEVFYWTHLLYIAFFILTIFHGPNFWKWFVAPGIIFLIERIHRSIRMRTGRGRTYISSGVLLPSKVIHLVIKRPMNFHFHPGDYVFVNIPAIAKYEWHPFTISSAPEQDDELWLHIRAVGEWTNRLYSYFEKAQEKCELQRCQLQVNGQAHCTSIIMHDGSAVKLRVDDVRDLQKKGSSPHMAGTPRVMVTAEPPSGNVNNPVAVRRNGITNHAFEPDSNGNTVDKEEEEEGSVTPIQEIDLSNPMPLVPIEKSSSPNTPNDSSARKKMEKSKSVPDLEKRLRNQDRNAMYIRRKPRVITLDIPSDEEECSSGSEEDTDSEEMMGKITDETQTCVTIAVPNNVSDTSALAAEEGRVRKKSQDAKQRRISRQEERQMRRKSRREEIIAEGGCAIGKPLVIFVDGPFGAPSSHIFHAQHAVLIATGIGVTPFASILQSIMHKYWKARHTCPKCTHSWTSDLPKSVMNLKKVDFFWINRDQRSFEWFVNLLSQLEIEQAEQGGVLERFLDMHMYITSALQKTDMKAVGLQLALDLLHEKEKRDLITGLKTRTNAGRPNWDKVFKQLQNQQKGKITVFYCGPPALGRTLRYKCDEYGFDFRKEIF